MKLAFAALVAIAALGVPAMAETMADASKMTCGDFAAMDKDGMMKATMAIKEGAMKDAMADKMKLEMSDEEVMGSIMKSCDGKPDMMAMDAMHEGM
jgi:HdeA/HdeB family